MMVCCGLQETISITNLICYMKISILLTGSLIKRNSIANFNFFFLFPVFLWVARGSCARPLRMVINYWGICVWMWRLLVSSTFLAQDERTLYKLICSKPWFFFFSFHSILFVVNEQGVNGRMDRGIFSLHFVFECEWMDVHLRSNQLLIDQIEFATLCVYENV